MVRRKNEWPEEGELVVGTVHKVLNYGAFATLEEYPGKEAFIHISEVSSGWVKNIRDFVRENQKIVARVLRVNPRKGHVDVSMKRIREDQRTKKIQAWKIEQKAEKFLELAAKDLGVDLDTAYEKVGYELMDIFGDLYGAFETAAEEGEQALIDEGIPEDWASAITEIARRNITPPEVQITGYVDIKSYAPNGVEIIRKALKSAQDEGIIVQAVGAPRYRLIVKSTDYLDAEKQLKEAAQKCIEIVEKEGGEGEFHRELT
ncbi:translation initiation factor IF-2 subunit alpha [Methanothermobacter wolfeii]|mgnify:FL=1|uniref:Translation initiation factor 2 subunit alpha n=1 Tax=Methanothermobacter wolfeii TaxID=145261 RepID=A0A9E7UN04_METWO|nr:MULTISPECIES: translation initiation factor IF-2 subunit alpha [Methanothermobacter]NLM02030.1 translation initiation factor IF-2 subunit alpha [Methanothermobacter wolfeii]QHN07015.1 translation initiation factor IF-2 subunit alpha [Methanothermobacter sp. THM-1]UXH31612.1 translation initiation factor IF-2 subunit alpha [Methanothermobacter wolfeii]SCM58538.1 Translation initiation factor 2 subunit alpha [Methanothermobacter wolfeii]